MSDPIFERDEVTSAFRYATHWWRSLVGAVDEDRWPQAALGEWNLIELVAHTNRVFSTLLDYVQGPVKDPTPIESASQYFRIVLAEQTPHVHIAERGRQEAATYGGRDPIVLTEDLSARALKLVEAAPADTVMHLFVGEMVLPQYLATRIVELVVHGGDLSLAIGLPTDPPKEAVRIALAVLSALATPADLHAMTRLVTGRSASLPLHNVLD